MPAYSVYLDPDIMESIKDLARTRNLPVSRLVREALVQYLAVAERPQARQRVLEAFRSGRPLGEAADWATIHRERTGADADRP